jgi:FkbM family methyltransferase
MATTCAGIFRQRPEGDTTMRRPSLMPIVKALNVDRAIRRNIYAYQLFRTYVGRFSFMLPLELEFHAFGVLPSTARLFLDIGANDGISARSFRLFNKTTPILSIEPNPCHEKALQRTKAALDLFDYKLIAAGDRRGELVLHTPVVRGIALSAYAAVDRSEAERRVREDMPGSSKRLRFIETAVPVAPIDDLTLTPDFVKIDVEGFEFQVLRGMAATIDRCRPVFMIEHHPESAESIADLLRPFGYRPYVFDRHASAFRRAGDSAADNLFYLAPSQQRSVPIIGGARVMPVRGI